MKPLDVDILNQEVLDHLNILKQEFYDCKEQYGLELSGKVKQFSGDVAETNPEYYMSLEYLQSVIDKGELHKGHPETYNAFPVTRMAQSNNGWETHKNNVKNNLATMFGATHSALASYYPPGGFVGWHTNWNCSTYQILFTWSETGDSYFLYKDPETGEIEKIQERAGWQAHCVYFGSQEEPNQIFWHAAYTNCERFAWALSWKNKSTYGTKKDRSVRQLVEMVIDEIQQN